MSEPQPADEVQPQDEGAQPPTQPSDYDDPVDEASDDSFPASDPPSFTESTATRDPQP
jgi:hypothetical protein